MRRLLLSALLSTLVAALLLQLWRPGSRGEDGEVTVAGDPQLFYLLEPGRTLRLALEAGTQRVKLIGLARLDESVAPASPGQEISFGFRVQLRDSRGEEVWATPIWLRSRVSQDGTTGTASFPRRRAYLATGEGLLTDERVLELDLGPVGLAGGELWLEADGESPWPVLIRPLRHHRDEGVDAPLGLNTLTDGEREELAGRVGIGAWHALHPSEREVLSTFRWQRMEASGARGRDYVTQRVVLTDLRVDPPDAATSQDALESLSPGRAVAVNLRGPAHLQIDLESLAGPGESGATEVDVVTVTQRGEVAATPVTVEAHGDTVHDLRLPPGEVVTVSILNRGPHPVRIAPRAGDTRGILFGRGAVVASTEPGDYVLGPEVRRMPMYRLHEGGDPVEYALRGGIRERLRLEARPIAGTGARVQVLLLDDQGGVLETSVLDCLPGSSPFEVVRQPGDAREIGAAGLPTTAEFWTHVDASRVRLEADCGVDVRVLVPLDAGWDPLEGDAAYELETEGVALRYEPQLDRRWSALAPDGLRELQAGDREVFLAAQVRLEPLGEAALQPLDGENPLHWRLDAPDRRGHAWFPDGEVARQRLLERWATSYSPSLVAGWPDGAHTSLHVGQPTTVVQRGAAGEAARLALWLEDGAMLGSDATLTLDGRDLVRIPLSARQIEIPVGPLPQGTHEVTLDAGDSGLTALLTLPPGDAAAARGIYRERTVYRLAKDRGVRISVPVKAGADAVLYLLPYYELGHGRSWPATTARCRVTIESRNGRRPGHLVDRTTPEVMEGDLPPSDLLRGFLADRSDRTLVAGDPVRIPLGEDLAGGTANLTLDRLDGGDALWFRLVALGVPPQPRPSGTQWVEELGHRQGAFAWADPFEPVDSLGTLVEAELAAPRGEYRLPSEGARAVARELGWRLAVAANTGSVDALPSLAAEAQGLGFALSPVRIGDDRYLLLRDGSGDGRGLLVLRFGGTASRVVLQAPHVFHDRHSGDIALALWEASSFPALQLNTRHRYNTGRADGGGAGSSSDLARRDDTWFHAVMLGLLDAIEGPLVVQVHGFGRTTVEDTTVDVIVSGGAYPRPEVVHAFADTLRELAPATGVQVYPDDTALLGAQLNRQGRAVAARQGGAFLHAELGPELRDVLRGDAAARATLLRAIAMAAESAAAGPSTGGAP